MVGRLFDDSYRSDKGPAKYSESEFGYLNRSARVDVAAVRAVLEEWTSRYPAEHRSELIIRFRSRDRWQHQSAVFELFLHELLTRLDSTPVIHAQATAGRRPDFQLTDSEGRRSFLEAALVTGESKSDQGARARQQDVYDAINRVDSPNFYVGVEIRQRSDRPVPGRKLITFLERCLDGENPELKASPQWVFREEGWDILFTAVPKSTSNRGKPGSRTLGYQLGAVQEVESWTSIRDTLRHKAGRYGVLETPYVIALNLVAEWPSDVDDVAQALFGQETFIVGVGSNELVFGREADGAWLGPTGPRNTRNSAVLVVDDLRPWTLASATATLYHNPWAQRPYDGPLTRLQCRSLVGQRLVAREGARIHDLLDLPAGWPGPRDIER